MNIRLSVAPLLIATLVFALSACGKPETGQPLTAQPKPVPNVDKSLEKSVVKEEDKPPPVLSNGY